MLPWHLIELTREYSLMVRKEALAERAISLDDLLSALKTSVPVGGQTRMVSPDLSFGEAFEAIVETLTTLGLQYFDDFVEVVGDFPQ